MKTLILRSIFLSFLFFSCSKDDLDTFSTLDQRMRNDGYFPLAPDNTWVYENRTAKLVGDQYQYEDGLETIESKISSTREVYPYGQSTPRIDFAFSLYNFNNMLGGIFGGLSQISKVGNEYYKKQTVSVTNAKYNGKEFKDIKLELEDQKFLKDPIEGDILKEIADLDIAETTDTFTSPDGGIKIDYTIKTVYIPYPPATTVEPEKYLRIVLDKIPDKYANKIQDNFLKNYDNVVHTQDKITINKITLTESGNNRIVLDARVEVDSTGSSIIAIDINNPERPTRPFEQGADLEGVLKLGIPGTFLDDFIVNLLIYSTEPLRVQTVSDSKLCKSTGNIKINTNLKGGPIEFVSNELFMTIDNFWAKGVGNIKNIIAYEEIDAKIDGKDYLTTSPFKINLTKDDPACGVGENDDFDSYPNTLGITIQLEVMLQNFKLDIPYQLTDEIVIQNLKKHKLRTNLN